MPRTISLPKDKYMSMVRTLRLPFGAIETSSVVGPFFWCAYDQDDDDPHLRKSQQKQHTSASCFLSFFLTALPALQTLSTANQTSAKKARRAAGR